MGYRLGASPARTAEMLLSSMSCSSDWRSSCPLTRKSSGRGASARQGEIDHLRFVIKTECQVVSGPQGHIQGSYEARRCLMRDGHERPADGINNAQLQSERVACIDSLTGRQRAGGVNGGCHRAVGSH